MGKINAHKKVNKSDDRYFQNKDMKWTYKVKYA